MRFDPKKYITAKVGTTFASIGDVDIRSETETVAWCDGVIVSTGTRHRFRTAVGAKITVGGDKKTAVSYYVGCKTHASKDGPIFTSVDRVPGNSLEATRLGLYKQAAKQRVTIREGQIGLIKEKLKAENLTEEETEKYNEDLKKFVEQRDKEEAQKLKDREEFDAHRKIIEKEGQPAEE